MGIFDSFRKKKPGEKPLNSIQDVLQNANAWLNKGISVAENGNHVEALHCFDKALELNPQLTEAGYCKGLSFYNMEDYQAAMTCFDKVLEMEPNHAEAWLYKGFCVEMTGIMTIDAHYHKKVWTGTGKIYDALACYNKALEINPKLFIAWGNKGALLISQANNVIDKTKSLELYQNGLECCNKALELAPESDQSWKVWNNKGAALGGLGKDSEALECYNKCSEFNPKDDVIWQNKARCFEKLESYQEAIECYKQALEIMPKNADRWYSKGFCLEKLRMFQEATECYEKILEIEPKGRPANILYDVGVNLERLGSYHKAKEALERFIISSPFLSSDPKVKQARDIIKRIKKMKLK